MTKDEIKRLDREAFWAEVKQPTWHGPLLALLAGMLVCAYYWAPGALILGVLASGVLYSAFNHSEKRRFANRRFIYKWRDCHDRVLRLRKAVAKAKGTEADHLRDLGPLVENVAQALYYALRRADRALVEIGESEGFRLSQPDTQPPATQDPTTARLWKVAQKTEEEYKRLLQGIMAGVERTEAQAALFIATLDTLRVKVLGARLAGGASDAFSLEAMQGLVEVRSQLDAIDKALEELTSSPFTDLPDAEAALGGMKDVRSRLDELSSQPGSPQADAAGGEKLHDV